MARSGFPSMTALLGLLAVAGYQNRDKLGQMLGNARGTGSGSGSGSGSGTGSGSGGLGGLLGGQGGGGGLDRVLSGLTGGAGGGMGGGLGGAMAGGGLGGLLGGGLSQMSDRFRQAGHGEAMDSWVGAGPNREVAPRDLEEAIGEDTLADLEDQTGLSRDELLSRLSRELPRAVNDYTPHGRLPHDSDFS